MLQSCKQIQPYKLRKLYFSYIDSIKYGYGPKLTLQQSHTYTEFVLLTQDSCKLPFVSFLGIQFEQVFHGINPTAFSAKRHQAS